MAFTATYPFRVHQINLGQHRVISYMDEGKGPQTIVFIHGLANYAPVWTQNLTALSKKFRVIALDLPGNGMSPYKGNAAFTMRFLAHCLIDFIGQMKLQHVCLCGHSMGGQIAMTALLEAPQCAERLALIAPAGFENFGFAEKMILKQGMNFMGFLASDEQQLREALRSSFYKSNPATKKIGDELTKLMQLHRTNGAYNRMVQQCIAAMVDEPVLEKLPAIQQPVLIIFGEQDALIPNKLLHHGNTRQLATTASKKFPNARLFLIKDAGHFVQWEKAKTVNELLEQFVSK